MGATRDDFIKYPRTPHLFGSKGSDDDKHLGRKESEAFIADPSLIVEEKPVAQPWAEGWNPVGIRRQRNLKPWFEHES